MWWVDKVVGKLVAIIQIQMEVPPAEGTKVGSTRRMCLKRGRDNNLNNVGTTLH